MTALCGVCGSVLQKEAKGIGISKVMYYCDSCDESGSYTVMT